MKYPCRCCESLVFSEPPNGDYDICPICYWEDDPFQFEHPDFAGGANASSLNEAKKIWQVNTL
ncbi:CPCC family cysteine-rich protein [Herbaspirillum autotrophicum]|uniref:CPCC family cysteine-rich protein n=1 Tax=Herbaspirillum autotrophicum TaxID=180195 RepID=UPI0009FA7062|nr:CPCC family cysteine-rich protein [Herbaspirillum autotrophicum]